MGQMADDILRNADWDADAYVWEDINGNFYAIDDIDNRYLFNILRFISNGGGYVDFLDDDKIAKLFNEANKRKIKHSFTLQQLKNAFHDKLSLWAQQPSW